MKFFKIISILFLSFILTACKEDEQLVASCTSTETSVEGYNDEIRSRDRMYWALYAEFKDSVINMIKPTDQAKHCLSIEVEKDISRKNFIEVTTPAWKLTLITVFEISTYFLLIYAIYSIGQLIYIAVARPTLDNDPTNLRYPQWIIFLNILKFVVLLVMCIPTGHDGLNIMQRYTILTPVAYGQERANKSLSTMIAWFERGNTEITKLSESSRKTSALSFKAYMMTNLMVKGKLRDNRTAKVEYSYPRNVNGKFIYYVENPSTMQYVHRVPDAIELKRYTMENQDAFSQKGRHLQSYSGRISFSKATYSEIGKKLAAASPQTFISSTPDEIPAKAESMKTAMIQKFGDEILKKPEVINKAVIEGVKLSLPSMTQERLIKEDSASTQIARLIEERACTLSPASKEVEFENKKFLKYANAGIEQRDLRNTCIGEKDGKYLSYGQRTIEAVDKDMDEYYKALYERNYEFLVSINAATKGITISQDSSNACRNARDEGVFGNALHSDRCQYINKAQQELTDIILQEMTFETVGFDHYIDTESRKLDPHYQGISNFLDDFDPIVERLFKTIPMNVTFGEVSQEEYIKGISDSYNVNAASEESIVAAFASPIEYLRKRIRKIDETSDPREITDALRGMFVQGVKAGSSIAMIGLGASAIDHAMDLNKNKAKKTDVGYSGKGDGKIQKRIKGFIKKLAATVGFGISVLLASVVGVFYFAIPTVIIIIMNISYLNHINKRIINAPFDLTRYARIDDQNNFVYHAAKIFNETFYLMWKPSLIMFYGVGMNYFVGESMIVVAEYIIGYPVSSMMEIIALLLMSVVMIWTVIAGITAAFLIGNAYIDRVLFGLEDESMEQYFNDMCMFITKWSLPFIGPIIAKVLTRK
ncbi:hypothetical protein ACCE15_19220 [Pseudomonas parafulva]|uniref:hypothetical protein n=1 Tax=Pseudomonas parafulva TaxID=157782 RepID=UPI00356A63FB